MLMLFSSYVFYNNKPEVQTHVPIDIFFLDFSLYKTARVGIKNNYYCHGNTGIVKTLKFYDRVNKKKKK